MNKIIVEQEGEANFYFLHNNKTWFTRIQFNGEFSTETQLRLAEKIAALLEKEKI